jgi:TatA/E family protein of Tat protein translocase
MGIENPVHLLFIAAVALIVLGPKRLPEVARALGHGIREFREAINQPPSPHAPPPAHEPPAAHEPPVVHEPSVAYEPAIVREPPVAHEPAGRPESVGPT